MINDLIFETFHNMTPEDAVSFLNDLADNVIHDKELWGYELKRCLHKWCVEIKGVCPDCGCDLEKNHKQEYLAEAWGRPIYEEVTDLYCENCGWSDEDNDD